MSELCIDEMINAYNSRRYTSVQQLPTTTPTIVDDVIPGDVTEPWLLTSDWFRVVLMVGDCRGLPANIRKNNFVCFSTSDFLST